MVKYQIKRTCLILGGAAMLGIIGGIFCFGVQLYAASTVEVVQASETIEDVKPEPKVVLIATSTNWTKERIEQEIRKVFHETPNTAVAVAKCESGLIPDIQSHHTLSYGREQSFGIMQIHAKDWDAVAKKLGFEKYKTDVEHNLGVARKIYDSAGGTFTDWTCYNNGDWKLFL
jgi:hypothetical protein